VRWLSVDPGEDTGWALWEDGDLVDAGTEKLWPFGEAVYAATHEDDIAVLELVGDELALKFNGIKRIVCEDFRIYPWEAKKGTLNWDQVRTARLIGALTLICKVKGLEWVLQGAKIKERAEAAGAESLFMSPLNENRHANDAIRHGVYYLAIERGARPVEMEGDGANA
jgi:hypothetical protein